MGDGWSSLSCTVYICPDRIMSRKKNLFIIGITLVLYGLNQSIKTDIPIEPIKWFMTCYFNDIIGGITFIAYCNMVFGLYSRKVLELWQIELLMFFSGIFWEYITPMFRANTISDVWDILAYMLGGFIYWLITRKERNEY